MNGIPPAIVDRANEIAALSARGENLVAVCAKMSAEETAALEEAVCIELPTEVKRQSGAHIGIAVFTCRKSSPETLCRCPFQVRMSGLLEVQGLGTFLMLF